MCPPVSGRILACREAEPQVRNALSVDRAPALASSSSPQCSAQLTPGLADEPLATDHWAYETIDELYAAGSLGTLADRQRARGTAATCAARWPRLSDRIRLGRRRTRLVWLQSASSRSSQTTAAGPEPKSADFEIAPGR